MASNAQYILGCSRTTGELARDLERSFLRPRARLVPLSLARTSREPGTSDNVSVTHYPLIILHVTVKDKGSYEKITKGRSGP